MNLFLSKRKSNTKKSILPELYLPEIQKQVKLIYDVKSYLAEG